ncbi:translocation protein [Trichodelitschia bisporula]|uniref:Translocation protein SEC62 n=1 Tax=Trichodelitschia bisporula TaxID=703511 RepID=A0A6G1I1A4_9PEZI|nr:translocation protein [Trichodelitschia bisporula]
MSAPPQFNLQPGQAPTPEQIAQIQAHMRSEAERLGLSMEQYVEQLKAQAAAQHRAQMEAQAQQAQQQHEQQQQEPVQPGAPKPEALAVANWLRGQDLKPRTCIFQEKRKDMFRVKRAMRALQSPAYEKARKKNPILPPVTDRVTAENVFKLLPLSLLALRVSKMDDEEEGHEGHNHGKKKRAKGLWTVRIEQQQDAEDEMHYMWLYEGPQWKQKAYALGALLLVFVVVMFPLWPLKLRIGVWYLSMGMLGLVAAFFVMAIFRLILFCITLFTHPPGLWLFPNLFEDVGFVESFIPLWGWQVVSRPDKADKALKKQKKAEKAAKRAAKTANGDAHSHSHGDHDHAHHDHDHHGHDHSHDGNDHSHDGHDHTHHNHSHDTMTTGMDSQPGGVVQRHMQPSIEEAEDD